MSDTQKRSKGRVLPWPKVAGRPVIAPRRMLRPCDYQLSAAIAALETQLGTIEAYNRMVEAAATLRAKIDAGNASPQNPLYATSIRG